MESVGNARESIGSRKAPPPLFLKIWSKGVIKGVCRESGGKGMRSRTQVEELAYRGGRVLKDFDYSKKKGNYWC